MVKGVFSLVHEARSFVSKESANMPKSFWGTQTAKQVLAIASFPLPQ